MRVLGELELEVDGEVVPYPPGRPGRLLAALLLARGRAVSSAVLVDEVWGDDLPGDAKAALHTTVARVRRALGAHAHALLRAGGGYRLDPRVVGTDGDIFLDLARPVAGDQPAGALDRCEGALALWRGAAWGELADDLAAGEARRLEDARLAVREERAAALLSLNRNSEAVGELRVLVSEHPLRERPVGLLMTALQRSGDVGGALDAFGQHRLRLADELGLDPAPELVELHGSLLRRESAGHEPSPTPPAAPAHDEERTRAPTPPPLHGRGAQVETLTRLLTLHRCVTVVGPGGVGKTSLAAHVVRDSVHWWIDLTSISDESQMRPTVAALLGVEVFPGDNPSGALRRRLAQLDGVLVLDNCEHLLPAAADLVADALDAGSTLRVLATSRERLGIRPEHVLPLPPLQLPAASTSALESPAVTLFWERARAVAPELAEEGAASDDALAVVTDVVRRLDGLPLAIELAAGRIGSITLEDLRERLGDRLDLLRGGSARAHGRQRTLTSTIEWSYELLAPDDRAAFLRLAVFAGPFDLTAAEAVLRGRVQGDAADLVTGLADRSLLTRPGSSGRGEYRMLETLRAFALARLDSDELTQVRRAHASYVLDLVCTAAEGMRGSDEPVAVRLLDAAAADVSAAFTWAVGVRDAVLASQIVGGLHRWAYFRLRNDVLGWANDVLALGGQGETSTALVVASVHDWMTGDYPRALRHGRRALELATTVRERAAALDALCDVALGTGDLDDAVGWAEEALRLALDAEEWSEATVAAVAQMLATTYAGGDARELVDLAHGLAARGGSPSWIAFTFYAEGEVFADRDPERALHALASAREVGATVGNRLVIGVSLTAETALLARVGPLDRDSIDRCCAAVEHWTAAGSETLFLTCLRNLVPLLARLEAHRALVELVAATRPQAAYGAEADRLQATLEHARDVLGEDAYAAALDTGTQRSPVDAGRALVDELRSVSRLSVDDGHETVG